ncbi:uncharacterized protein PHALS_05012 [Plasmopara halstedii]|uniref:Uncharacterized protein n=1 Tax=Plasmopara halstedii TaxID=4781 RepID=A0A0P1A9K6_PLAHL|nr:uncharacterized protein PHALS_05012 [Plasmopara halstedii]CEG37418.1 hypothetical protein PHALS_05012 [Plasmopara halstedii]|eukprot:XP_024573787.1 hypothetical protein PHALS_05012 [Plasmopara halstedii]
MNLIKQNALLLSSNLVTTSFQDEKRGINVGMLLIEELLGGFRYCICLCIELYSGRSVLFVLDVGSKTYQKGPPISAIMVVEK